MGGGGGGGVGRWRWSWRWSWRYSTRRRPPNSEPKAHSVKGDPTPVMRKQKGKLIPFFRYGMRDNARSVKVTPFHPSHRKNLPLSIFLQLFDLM